MPIVKSEDQTILEKVWSGLQSNKKADEKCVVHSQSSSGSVRQIQKISEELIKLKKRFKKSEKRISDEHEARGPLENSVRIVDSSGMGKTHRWIEHSLLRDSIRKFKNEIDSVFKTEKELKRGDNAPIALPDGGQNMDDIHNSSKQLDQLNLITQKTRANLLQNVLGHRWMMPSSKELSYYNPSKSPGTISGHLEKLVDGGILMRVTVPQGERERDLPNTFFTLSDEGYTLLKQHSLFLPHIDEIKKDHRRVEKTEQIQQYELARRPTVNVDYQHPLSGDGMSIVDPSEHIDSSTDTKNNTRYGEHSSCKNKDDSEQSEGKNGRSQLLIE